MLAAVAALTALTFQPLLRPAPAARVPTPRLCSPDETWPAVGGGGALHARAGPWKKDGSVLEEVQLEDEVFASASDEVQLEEEKNEEVLASALVEVAPAAPAVVKKTLAPAAAAAAGLAGLVTLGVDIAAVDLATHAELAVGAAAAVAYAANEDAGLLGDTLRSVGNLTKDVWDQAQKVDKELEISITAQAVGETLLERAAESAEVAYEKKVERDAERAEAAALKKAEAASVAERSAAAEQGTIRAARQTISGELMPSNFWRSRGQRWRRRAISARKSVGKGVARVLGRRARRQ